MVYELREYVAAEGRSGDLHQRFAEHVLPLFEECGIDVVQFWNVADDEGYIVYVVRFDDDRHRSEAWAKFQAHPRWKQVKAESEARGPLVERIVGRAMVHPSYWPPADQSDSMTGEQSK